MHALRVATASTVPKQVVLAVFVSDSMKPRIIAGMAMFAWLVASSTTSAQQANPASTQNPPNKTSDLPETDNLRIRLRFHPHDAVTHNQLFWLLFEKNAFRAIVVEDATWLGNNRSRWFALDEIVSYCDAFFLNDPEYAIAQLRRQLSAVARKEDPKDFDDSSERLAAELQKRGRPQEALPLFKDLVRLNPSEAGFWADYGDVLSALGKNTEAVKAFQRSIELDPSVETIHEVFAETLLKSGDLSGAESEYRAALSVYEAEPTNELSTIVKGLKQIEKEYGEEHALAEMQMKLAHILLLDKKYDEAVIQAKAALDADYPELTSFYLQAQIYDAKGDHAQANAARKKAEAIVSQAAGSWVLGAREFTQAHNFGVEKQIPEVDPRVLFLTDTLWNEQSGYSAFPSEIVSILEPRIASLSSLERVQLANAYFAQGRVMDGKEQWEKAIASDNPQLDNAISQFDLGEQLLKSGALNAALPHLQRAYELDPQNVTYRMDYESVRRRLGLAQY